MRLLGLIPTHYNAKRYPGKPLIDINGEPMIVRVFKQAKEAQVFDTLRVTTDDQRIIDALKAHEVPFVRTSSNPRNGTERCAEALTMIKDPYDFVCNLQGDEPFIQPDQLRMLAQSLTTETQILTLMKRIDAPEVFQQSATVKVVFDKDHHALYFSRCPIPYVTDHTLSIRERLRLYPTYKHIGVYFYRYDVLPDLVRYEKGRLEQAESLEQLRWLAQGYRIRLVETAIQSYPIDTPADLARVKALGLC